jgi:SAM-dependent methyltransferase
MRAREDPVPGGTAPRHATRTAWKLAGFARKHIHEMRRSPPEARYLDVGCGNGFVTGFVADGFHEVHGIDTEPQRLQEFREIAAHLPNHHIHQMSASEICFEDNYFDLVTLFEVLEHVPDLTGSANEIVRVLCPGGVLVVSVPQPWFPIENHGIRWRGRNLERKIPLLPYIPPLHRRYALARVFSSSAMDRLFVTRGLELIATGYAAPQFERAGARAGSIESRIAFVRPLLERCETIPGLRALTGVSMLKAYRKPDLRP